jgi:hypothetical protein
MDEKYEKECERQMKMSTVQSKTKMCAVNTKDKRKEGILKVASARSDILP